MAKAKNAPASGVGWSALFGVLAAHSRCYEAGSNTLVDTTDSFIPAAVAHGKPMKNLET